MKFDIAKLDSQFEVIQESMKQEKVYLADKQDGVLSPNVNKSLDGIEQSMFPGEKQMMKAIRLSYLQAFIQAVLLMLVFDQRLSF